MKFNTPEALAFLSTLDQIHLVAISPTTKAEPQASCFDNAQDAIDWAIPRNSNEWGIYWTASAVPTSFTRKPAKANIRGARFAYVDIDPPKNGGAFDKPSVLAALEGHDCAPSFIIDSGNGLQAFWRLCEEHSDLAEVESVNRQLRDYYDADPACWNIDRLMRLPGSINWPTLVKKARGRKPAMASMATHDNGLAYWPREIAAAFPASKPVAQSGEVDMSLANVPKVIGRKTPEDLGIKPGSSLYDLITQPIEGDRSGAGLRCVRIMASEGYTDAQIAGVLANGDLPISGHYIDQANTHRAITRAIAIVRADIPEIQQSYFDLDAFVANAAKKRAAELAVEPSIIPELSTDKREPNWLKGLSGPLRAYIDYNAEYAPKPQPLLALVSGLVVFSAVAARRYESPTGFAPNLYGVGIAEAGSGKDFTLKTAQRLLIAAGLNHVLGAAEIASGAAIITDLKKQPNLLYTIDEFGMMLSALSNPAKAPKYLTDIIKNLTSLYTMSSSTYMGVAYANQEERPREIIESPCLSLYGVTTPHTFWNSFTGANAVDGSLARMLIMETELNYPPPRRFKRGDIPVSLVLTAQAINEGADGHKAFPLGEHSTQVPKPYTVPYADDLAQAEADKIEWAQDTILKKYEGTGLNGILNRLFEVSVKVALIRAICDNPKRPAITKDHLEWAYMITKMSVDYLLRAVKEKVADNEGESKLKRVHAEIAKAGHEGIGRTELSRACKFMGSTRALNDAIDMLTDSGMIKCETVGTGGAPKRTYYDISD